MALQTDKAVNFVLYSPDQLKSEIQWTYADGKWHFSGPIHLHRDGKRIRTFELNYSSENPNILLLNKQKFVLVNIVAVTSTGAFQMSGRLLALTADRPPLNTQRTLALRSPRNLETIHKMARRDLALARHYRFHRQLDAMTGWVLSWNDQHAIQHSDGAHVAQMRIFADGRAIVPDRKLRLLTLKLPKKELDQLLSDLRQHPKARRLGKQTPTPANIEGQKNVFQIFRGGLWDQYASRILVESNGATYSLYYLSKSADGRPQTGMTDEAWAKISKRLYTLVSRVRKSAAD